MDCPGDFPPGSTGMRSSTARLRPTSSVTLACASISACDGNPRSGPIPSICIARVGLCNGWWPAHARNASHGQRCIFAFLWPAADLTPTGKKRDMAKRLATPRHASHAPTIGPAGEARAAARRFRRWFRLGEASHRGAGADCYGCLPGCQPARDLGHVRAYDFVWASLSLLAGGSAPLAGRGAPCMSCL